MIIESTVKWMIVTELQPDYLTLVDLLLSISSGTNLHEGRKRVLILSPSFSAEVTKNLHNAKQILALRYFTQAIGARIRTIAFGMQMNFFTEYFGALEQAGISIKDGALSHLWADSMDYLSKSRLLDPKSVPVSIMYSGSSRSAILTFI